MDRSGNIIMKHVTAVVSQQVTSYATNLVL